MAEPIIALIADDHAEIRSVLRRVLQDSECEVHVAEDGERAVEMLESLPVSILLLDLQMPRLTGFGVLEAIRDRKDELAQPMTLIVTAHADVEGRVRGTQLGAIDFVEKPFRIPAMRARIDRMIAMVRMERGVGEAEASLALMRSRDPVTGVGSFAMLRPVLDAQFATAEMTETALTCLVVCDEEYDRILHEQGKEFGDERLRTIASALDRELRGSDLVFRVDAAELVVLLPGTPATDVPKVIERLEGALGAFRDQIYFASATYPHPQLKSANQLYRGSNVTLAQLRSRESDRSSQFSGF